MRSRRPAVTVRADNSPRGLAAIGRLWEDVQSGKLPLLFDSQGVFQPGLSPVSRYGNYENDQTGAYDLTILTVTADFFAQMEEKAAKGLYRKFEAAGEDLNACAQAAWEQVWGDPSLKRAFAQDYESTVPAEYAKDGKCHCYLYISVKE